MQILSGNTRLCSRDMLKYQNYKQYITERNDTHLPLEPAPRSLKKADLDLSERPPKLL